MGAQIVAAIERILRLLRRDRDKAAVVHRVGMLKVSRKEVGGVEGEDMMARFEELGMAMAAIATLEQTTARTRPVAAIRTTAETAAMEVASKTEVANQTDASKT